MAGMKITKAQYGARIPRIVRDSSQLERQTEVKVPHCLAKRGFENERSRM